MITIARLIMIGACAAAYFWFRLLGALFGNSVLTRAGEACRAVSLAVGMMPGG